MVRWTLFSAFLLLEIAFATAVLVIFRAEEVASPTRGGISPSEMTWPWLRVTCVSAAVGFVSLGGATFFWMLRPVPAAGAGTVTGWAARASLVLIPSLLFLAQLVGIRRFALAVTKMDLVDYDQTAFVAICADYRRFAD